MTTANLPPLPEPVGWLAVWHGEHRAFWRSSRLMRSKANAEDIVSHWNACITPRAKSYAVEAVYTAAQVEGIRRAAILAERERCAKVCEEVADLRAETERLTGEAAVLRSLLRECDAVLSIIDPENDDEAQDLARLRQHIRMATGGEKGTLL